MLLEAAQQFNNSASRLVSVRQDDFQQDSAVSVEVATVRLNEFIAQEIASVPEVECVYTIFRNDVLFVWIVVSKYEKAVRARIYGIEQRIIEEFADLELDFYIVDRPNECEEGDIVSEAELAYKRVP